MVYAHTEYQVYGYRPSQEQDSAIIGEALEAVYSCRQTEVGRYQCPTGGDEMTWTGQQLGGDGVSLYR